MKYNLKKKTTLWELFNKELKIFFSIIGIGVTSICLTIKEIQLLLLKVLELAVTYGIYILIPLNIWFYGSLLYYWGRYFYRHLFVPLSQEEMEENNIHTLPEYLYFLRIFFDGKAPLIRVQKAIIESAKKYLNKDDNGNAVYDEDLELFEDNLAFTPLSYRPIDVEFIVFIIALVHFMVFSLLYLYEIRIPIIIFGILPIIEYFVGILIYKNYKSFSDTYCNIHFHLFRIGYHFDIKDSPVFYGFLYLCKNPWKGYYKFNDKFKEEK